MDVQGDTLVALTCSGSGLTCRQSEGIWGEMGEDCKHACIINKD